MRITGWYPWLTGTSMISIVANRFYIRDNDREVLKNPSLGSMWIKLRIGLAENGVYLPNPSAMVL